MTGLPTETLVVVGNSEGGGTRVALDLLSALDSTRFHSTLVAPMAPELAVWAEARDIDYRPAPLLDSRAGGAALRQLRATITDVRPTIIHAHGTRAAWFVSRCLPARGVSGTPALIYSEHLFSFEARRGPARLPWLALEAWLCRRADAMTTSCERNARFAERVRRGTVALRHYGIDVAAIQRQAASAAESDPLPFPPEAVVIGSVGRLIPQKGLRYLIEAAPDVIAAEPAARFVIVGDGPERSALEAQCRAAGLSDRFHFAGAHPQPWTLLARCAVIALPSLWEGLPLTLLEALAAGLPVVTSDVGGAREALGVSLAAAGLAPPRDARALASALVGLLGAPVLRERYRREGPAIAARYDIQETQRRCRTLYERLEGAHGARRAYAGSKVRAV